MGPREDVAAALRQIARGFEALADAVAADPGEPPEPVRAAALLRAWGDRGLSRAGAGRRCRRPAFAPRCAGGWAGADWMETRADGLRYITEGSRRWVAEVAEQRSAP